jgi:uncharacterized protein (DUF983 family)
MMNFIFIGFVTAANFLILKIKAEQNRWADLLFDIFVLSVLSFLFSGSLGGLTIAMVSSFVVSIYLYFYPPDLKKIFKPFYPKNK